MKIHFSTFTECGIRANNQDYVNVVCEGNSDDMVFVVCDGMGGHAMGDIANTTVGTSISNYWNENINHRDSKKKVLEACHQASVALDKKSDALNHAQMGTTLAIASIEGSKVTIAHCGDSRCYLLRNSVGVLYQTKDHVETSFGWEVVTRCFFSYKPEAADPDIEQFELLTGDRLFLCMDGVYKSMFQDSLITMLMDEKALCEITDAVEFMCEKFSDDNYSGALIEVE